jgi:ketosteroid isomerase-like protein
MIGALIAKNLVRRSYDSMNRGDMPAIMSGWRDDATFTYPGHISVSGTRKGKDEIEEWFRHFIAAVPTRTFKPLSVSVENIFDFVGNNVIAVQWEDRPVNKLGEEFYVRGVTVSTVRRGKVTSATVYILDCDVLPRLWGEARKVPEAVNASG